MNLETIFTKLVLSPIDNTEASNLRKARYPEAIVSNDNYHRYWNNIHSWCEENFGERYAWCGDSFFFTNDNDRLLFALKWS